MDFFEFLDNSVTPSHTVAGLVSAFRAAGFRLYEPMMPARIEPGKGYCIVNGQKAPYVGNICMDVCMIDLTGIDAIEGDDVIVFGPENPIEGVAAKLNTISYEVLTGVNNRVQRIYVRE